MGVLTLITLVRKIDKYLFARSSHLGFTGALVLIAALANRRDRCALQTLLIKAEGAVICLTVEACHRAGVHAQYGGAGESSQSVTTDFRALEMKKAKPISY